MIELNERNRELHWTEMAIMGVCDESDMIGSYDYGP